jgi:class 3 adenylate cyclase/CHAT domain-containing protein
MEENRNELEKILEERLRLDSILQEQFSRRVTVMFTDIKGSTAFFEAKGDLAGRTMIHQHNSLVLPVIDENHGVLIKTIGDATMSMYENPADGVRAAAAIMQRLKVYNAGKAEREQIHVRAGLNYGVGIVEQNDVYGDLVNVASRVESLASAGEIYVTEDLYRVVKHDDEFIFRFVKDLPVKGKSLPLSVYRVVWQQEDLKLGRVRSKTETVSRRDGLFVIEASLRNETIKIIAHERSDGEERPVKNFHELPFNQNRIDGCVKGIMEILHRANQHWKTDNSLLVQLKESGTALYAALLPEEVRKQLATTEEKHLLLSIDEALVQIPWELIFDGTTFLCQRFNIGRSVKTRATVSSAARAVSRPLKMLVLADPRNDLPASRREGAMILEEMENVADWLDVTLKDTAITTAYVRDKIRNFDIVHYAGHAEISSAPGGTHGWLLQDGVLTAEEIARIPGTMPMPALVFSNACQSGDWQTATAFENQVFSLANSFLLAGVQHYIGTFWEIPDEPGYLFACSFYADLARGATVGEALRLARQALIAKFGEDTIVWAGYLLYGDPTSRYIDLCDEKDTDEKAKIAQEPIGQQQELPHLTVGWAKSDDRSKIPWVLAAGILLAIALASAHFLGRNEAEIKAAQQQPAAATPQASSKEIDDLVTSLAASYRSGTPAPHRTDDGWSTPPLTMVLLDIQGTGLPSKSVDLFVNRLNQYLQAEAGVPMVERQLLGKLLQELKLSSSSLADPSTALKLGKVLSARLMVTGSMTPVVDGQAVALRIIDTETTAIKKVITVQSTTGELEGEPLSAVGKQIADWLKEEFPVRGTVQAVAGNSCRLNLGKTHGLKKGTTFEVVQEAKKGTGIYAVMGELKVTEVEKDSSVAAFAGNVTSIKEGDRVRLKL